MNNIKKIDIHAHAVLDNKVYPKYLSGDSFVTPEELLAEYEKIGVEKACLLPLASPEAMPGPISTETCKLIADKYPDKFYWFCNVDPRAGGNSEKFDLAYLINFYKELGAKGIGEVTANLYADDPMVDNLFRAAAQCDMPVTIHLATCKGGTYGIIDDIGLPRIEKLLKKYPDLKLVGHSPAFWSEISADLTEADRSGYPSSSVKEGRLSQLMRECPNLYCDLSAGSGANALMRDPEFAVKFLNEFSDRIMYACDICIKGPDFPVKLDLFFDKLLEEKAISMETYTKIMRENAIRTYNLG